MNRMGKLAELAAGIRKLRLQLLESFGVGRRRACARPRQRGRNVLKPAFRTVPKVVLEAAALGVGRLDDAPPRGV
jgi:hypothetical protein